ncbi:siderophore-interacting protein [Kibdelosporangium phytohabitans]|uniref:Iron utilization protein n=1 Tax=Kibdelosporangium phytohabitans TaxID=860235 RepID=A0A0N9IB42_9PSEU|nr:siderophore-interacting protein [Kibdelosporangium phytohabitans]ALG11837.1 iron utilization protein [Kibdelosporangium phytohabitans]MBE1463259.1 NADPH-dependent ferric siderophore reductase [Kibdelosporangium phytohabitans]
MSRAKPPERRKMIRATVARTSRISRNFVTVTLTGEELAEFEHQGFDQCVRLFFRRDGQDILNMPTFSNNAWLAQFLLTRVTNRPWVRNYTVRAFRTDPLEMDIEFALHGDTGPASVFATSAQPGDPVGIFDEGIGYLPAADAARQLIVADESAVPAALAILEGAPETLQADVYLEVPDADDIREVETPADVTVHWLARNGSGDVPGNLALRTLRSSSFSVVPQYTWVAGESALVTGVRRYLVQEVSVPRSTVTFIGYWRYGRASPG